MGEAHSECESLVPSDVPSVCSCTPVDHLVQLAKVFMQGSNGVERSLDVALRLYEMAAEKGSTEAMAMAGVIHIGAENVDRGMHWLLSAAERGDGQSMVHVALYHTSAGELDAAVSWLERAVEAKQDTGAVTIASRILEAPKADCQERAAAILREFGGRGDATAQNNLACYYLQQKTAAGNADGLRLLEQAAQSGLACAMYNLAEQYRSGAVVKRSMFQAVEWYRRAEAAGEESATARLCEMLPDEPDKDVCSACGAPGDSRCSGCLTERYCSPECQQADWKRHKVHCYHNK